MRITIFGSGYMGLVTGACLADVGHDVLCVDVDAEKVARLEVGEVPIYEPGLESLIRQNRAAGRLRFTCDAEQAVAFGLQLTKYAANAMLATKISFINEFANLSERLGADIEEVGHPAEMIAAVERVNARQKSRLFEMLRQAFNGQLAGKTIALWGLALKPNTDDMREAPSRALMEALWEAGARVQAFAPEAAGECRRIYGERDDLRLASQRDEVLEGADALVICTEWKAFRTVDFAKLRESLASPLLVDGRNLFPPEDVKAAGLAYYAIGRGDSVRPVLA